MESIARTYRKVFFRKGDRIHSPFAYNLITKVIEERLPYYAFDEIERHYRRRDNYGRLLFRLINYFRCRSVIIIGNTPEYLGLYAAMVSPRCTCYLVDEDNSGSTGFNRFVESHNLRNIRRASAVVSESRVSEREDDAWTLIAVNRGDRIDAGSLPVNRSIFVINNISKDKALNACWQTLRQNKAGAVSIDLFEVGLVIFDKKLVKAHYKTYFNL